MQGALEVYFKEELLRVISLDTERITVGRNRDNIIHLPHSNVSRRHGEFHIGAGITYHDLSRYGSHVAGANIKGRDVTIINGMSVEIGQYRIIYNQYSTKRDSMYTDVVQSGSSSARARWTLTLHSPNGKRRAIELDGSPITVGVGDKKNLLLNNVKDARVTMTFITLDDGLYLNVDDPKSLYVNGEHVGKGLLKLSESDSINYVGYKIFHNLSSLVDVKYPLIGVSVAADCLRRDIAKAATRLGDLPVLVLGETGTGKELVARLIHEQSSRAKAPFVAVNCAAIPELLAESLFFGHRAGSFTNAIDNHVGYFEQANGGTLFLDEVGEISASLQSKLLRAIEYQEICPIGANKAIKTDVRIVSASNRPLNILERRRSLGFRDDFYFRISGYGIEVVPLRQRLDDIPVLVAHYHAELTRKYPDFKQVKILKQAFDVAKSHPWIGNIRELKYETEKAVLLADDAVTRIPVFQTSSPDLENFCHLLNQGKSKAEIMTELNIARSTYYRMRSNFS